MNKITVGGLVPITRLHPVIKNNILKTLRKFDFEEQLLALVLWHMIRQLDEGTQSLKYIQKNLKTLAKINMATRYVTDIVDATNRVWLDSFKELPNDVSIAGFLKTFVFRREKQFKKIGVNIKDFIKLDTLHGANKHTMGTLKVISLMLKKVEDEKKIDAVNVQEWRDKKSVV